MKTISMPLEEYEKEKSDLQKARDQRSYDKGAIDMANLIRERVIYGRRESWYQNNPDLTKVLEKLVDDIKKDQTQRSLITSNK